MTIATKRGAKKWRETECERERERERGREREKSVTSFALHDPPPQPGLMENK